MGRFVTLIIPRTSRAAKQYKAEPIDLESEVVELGDTAFLTPNDVIAAVNKAAGKEKEKEIPVDKQNAAVKNSASSAVSHPEHYVAGRLYEPKDVIRDWGLNFNLGNVVKYVARAGRKGDKLEDLQKARQYLDFEIAALKQ
jgi:hypothetical protein